MGDSGTPQGQEGNGALRSAAADGRPRPDGAEALYLHAPAKVNLFLGLQARRDDGYHDVRTCLHTLALGDDVSVQPADEGVHLEVRAQTGSGFAVPSGPDNLVCRAADAVQRTTGRTDGVRFRLTKRIPAGAGLGGGSSDAAAALLLVNALYGEPLDTAALHELGRGIGADVPFFLRAGTQIATGIGDRLEAVPSPPRFHFVLIVPPQGCSTAEVYGRCEVPATARPNDGSLDRPELWWNDLEPAALAVQPGLAQLRDRIVDAGFETVRMSGSGSSWFVAFAEREEAARAHETLGPLRESGVALFLTQSDPRPAGPRVPSRGEHSARPSATGEPTSEGDA